MLQNFINLDLNYFNMIVVTGAAGFIASCLVSMLNEKGYTNLVLVDDFSHANKRANYESKKYKMLVERSMFFDWLAQNHADVEFVYHLGARTDTTEFNREIFETLNIAYTKKMWSMCTQYQIPLLYASSAATYGLGDLGYSDAHEKVPQFKPLNPYGDSKQWVDEWVLQQKETPPYWYGIKFFNVYGPNEYHKARMASVVFHAYNQIRETGKVKLFKSHVNEYKNGEQLRDFIYVKDAVNVLFYLHQLRTHSGIYNLGTGTARTFYDLASATFAALELIPNIEFVDMPIDIRDKYQYYTKADMHKLMATGYAQPFHTLEKGIANYVQAYLKNNARY